jgi:hypothetical protein
MAEIDRSAKSSERARRWDVCRLAEVKTEQEDEGKRKSQPTLSKPNLTVEIPDPIYSSRSVPRCPILCAGPLASLAGQIGKESRAK